MLRRASGLLYSLCLLGCKAGQVITLKVGLYAHTFLTNGSSNSDGAQSLAGFMLAADEINKNKLLLPDVRIVVALRGDDGSYGAITAAQSFLSANFTEDSQGRVIPASTFVNENPIGVDVILGAGNDLETQQMNQVLNYFQIVQLHTVATSSNLAIGANYPYKVQTTPISSFDGRVLQNVFCTTFGIKKVAVFLTDDTDGIKSLEELTDGTYCHVTTLSTQTFPDGIADFSTMISNVQASGALIFVLFMPVQSAALFLEQAYDQGLLVEGTLVFANSLANDNAIWSYFTDPSKTKGIMNGYFGMEYDSKFPLHSTQIGKSFVTRFSEQTDTVALDGNGSYLCSNITDDTGEYLYRRPPDLGTPAACSGLHFSSFLPEGTNMYSNTPHAYDAMYALALGVEQILDYGEKNNITGNALHYAMLHNVSFEGATGKIKFELGNNEYQDYSMGDREVGFTYLLYNFNNDLFDSTGGSIGLALVGAWALEDGGAIFCSNDTVSSFGTDCVSKITYRTSDNKFPSDTLPDIFSDTPKGIRVFLRVLGSFVSTVVLMSFGVAYRFHRGSLMRESQPPIVFIIHFGCLLGGLTTLVGGLPLTDSTCNATYFLGHIAFIAVLIPLLAKVWRLGRVFNNKSLKPVNIPWRLVTACTWFLIFLEAMYLVATLVVGKPYQDAVSTTVSNQTTHVLTCNIEVSSFRIAAFVYEGLLILYSLILMRRIKGAPDPVDDIKFIKIAVGLISIVCLLVAPVVTFLSMPIGIAALIVGIGFGFLSLAVVVILFYPKYRKLYLDPDLRVDNRIRARLKSTPTKVDGNKKMLKMFKKRSLPEGKVVNVKDLWQDSYETTIALSRDELRKWQLLHMELNDGENKSLAAPSSSSHEASDASHVWLYSQKGFNLSSSSIGSIDSHEY